VDWCLRRRFVPTYRIGQRQSCLGLRWC